MGVAAQKIPTRDILKRQWMASRRPALEAHRALVIRTPAGIGPIVTRVGTAIGCRSLPPLLRRAQPSRLQFATHGAV